ncbi:hypothetical protein LTR27_007187 [Elasticomyces elasticus]|nr:hypothetical protein LTR27_007187 [Elasticomyces elasticus]
MNPRPPIPSLLTTERIAQPSWIADHWRYVSGREFPENPYHQNWLFYELRDSKEQTLPGRTEQQQNSPKANDSPNLPMLALQQTPQTLSSSSRPQRPKQASLATPLKPPLSSDIPQASTQSFKALELSETRLARPSQFDDFSISASHPRLLSTSDDEELAALNDDDERPDPLRNDGRDVVMMDGAGMRVVTENEVLRLDKQEGGHLGKQSLLPSKRSLDFESSSAPIVPKKRSRKCCQSLVTQRSCIPTRLDE